MTQKEWLCLHSYPDALLSGIASSSHMGSRADLCKVNPIFLLPFITALEMCSVGKIATNSSK